ncbi:ESX secretion-associated protein EspG [Skermania piniformis]|uniref:ESX secretion-associated protein EspG n=1 Tax=Skermania pinensis TaxID=39122 RepID=A0ABX8SAS7_9ACTN|nr:ESX secretion-associated protein EspG [Skermania piniformis]QXQ14917.1 ESX secretion-associated protein EspG [Skermania piniformis]
MSWSFTLDEFAHVWLETGAVEYPYPIRVVESARTEPETVRLHEAIAQRLPTGADQALTGALELIARPDARLVAIGGRTDDEAARIRIHGALAADRAALLVQQPGIAAEFGGIIRLHSCPADRLAARAVAILPPAARGRAGRSVEPGAALAGESPLGAGSTRAPSTSRQARRVLSAPRTAEGHIRIETGLRTTQPDPPQYLSWVDVVRDGRYLIRTDGAVRIAPVSSENIADYLQQALTGRR